jgi:TatD DNase family protein
MIDSHAHLTHPQVLPHIDTILARARAAQIVKIINICMDAEGLNHGSILCQRYPWIFNAAAIHPHDVATKGESDYPLIATAAHEGHLIAIGETGLDYYHEHSPRHLQQYFLQRHLQLADACNLPVIVHCREAFQDLFRFACTSRAILHCFTGTLEDALHCIERGWLISFSGILTYKKSQALREVARAIPLEHLLIETDTPYLAPQSKRGKTNEPAFLSETARCLAEVKQVSFERIVESTSTNAMRILK